MRSTAHECTALVDPVKYQYKNIRFRSCLRCRGRDESPLELVKIVVCNRRSDRLCGQIAPDNSNGKNAERMPNTTTTSTCQHLPPNQRRVNIVRTPVRPPPTISTNHRVSENMPPNVWSMDESNPPAAAVS